MGVRHPSAGGGSRLSPQRLQHHLPAVQHACYQPTASRGDGRANETPPPPRSPPPDAPLQRGHAGQQGRGALTHGLPGLLVVGARLRGPVPEPEVVPIAAGVRAGRRWGDEKVAHGHGAGQAELPGDRVRHFSTARPRPPRELTRRPAWRRAGPPASHPEQAGSPSASERGRAGSRAGWPSDPVQSGRRPLPASMRAGKSCRS